jgi:hypothetical protein
MTKSALGGVAARYGGVATIQLRMVHRPPTTRECLLALISSSMEKVLAHFCGGAGGDAVEQAMGMVGRVMRMTLKSGANATATWTTASPVCSAGEAVLAAAAAAPSPAVAYGPG